MTTVSLSQFVPGVGDLWAAGAARAAVSVVKPSGDRERVLIDSHGRRIHDLRLSITDRCNFRCVYCMDPDVRFAESGSLLRVEEMERVIRACVTLGVRRVRVTGGEPTLHPQLAEIIAVAAAELRRAEPSLDAEVSMTTNGSLITRELLAGWKAAGLKRLTFSMDSVDETAFRAMTRSKTGAARVRDSIAMAIEAGLGPVKANAVVIRGRNEDQVPKLAALARELGFEMRFIEFMPLDSGKRWDRALVVPAEEIIERAQGAGMLRPMGRAAESSTSETYVFADDGPEAAGRVGVIAPVTRPFCGACSRLRVTADGKVRPCLFSRDEFDLMSVLRGGGEQREVEDVLLGAVWNKQAGHGISSTTFVAPERPMSAIGG